MRINRGRESGEPTEKRGPTFTGTVWADPVLADTGEVLVNTVFFQPGARTHWHTHGSGQVLLVIAGSGFAYNEAGEGGPIRAGDAVWFEAGERHWHGAGPDTLMTHTAVSLGGTFWEDPVTDEQYEKACARPS